MLKLIATSLLGKSDNSIPDGRKFRMGQLMMLMMLGGLGLASLTPVIASLYSEFTAGLIGIYVIYTGGNVSNKWVLGKKPGKKSMQSSSSDLEDTKK